MDSILFIVVAIIVILILLFIFLHLMKNRKPKQVTSDDIPVDIDEIIKAVGGKDNIKDTTATSSKVTFFINDDSLVSIDGLKALGASGIVQTSNKVSAILGKYSKEISNLINDK